MTSISPVLPSSIIICVAHVAFRALVGDHSSRDAHHNRIIRDIFRYDAVCSNGHVAANFDRPNHFRPRSDVNIVTNRRVARIFTPVGLPKRNAWGQVAVLADLAERVDENAAEVPDIETAADLGLEGDANAELIGVML